MFQNDSSSKQSQAGVSQIEFLLHFFNWFVRVKQQLNLFQERVKTRIFCKRNVELAGQVPQHTEEAFRRPE